MTKYFKIARWYALICCLQPLIMSKAFGQQMDLSKFDILIHDTLISKPDFIAHVNKMDSARLKRLVFAPITDGYKVIYYLNRRIYAKGEIKHKLENGVWTYWHEGGQKAREGKCSGGKREGIHTYWYPNGKLRGVGSFVNDEYDGKWMMYKEDGTETTEQIYKKGKLVR